MMDALRHHMQHVRSRRGRDQENRRDVEPPDMQRHGFSPLQASAQPSVRVERGRDTDAPASRLRSKRTDEGRLAPIPGKNKRAPKASAPAPLWTILRRSEEHTSELQSLMRT